MDKLIKENKITAVVVIILIIVGVFYFYKNKLTTREASVWNDSYAKQIWDRFSMGDVSSAICEKAIEEYKKSDSLYDVYQNPVLYSKKQVETLMALPTNRIFESLYSYSKKRCFGFDSRNFNGSNGKYAGHTDKIFDLITGDTIVSCTLDYSKETQDHLLVCSDAQNNWTADNDSRMMPPPYPIASNTWAALNTLGRE